MAAQKRKPSSSAASRKSTTNNREKREATETQSRASAPSTARSPLDPLPYPELVFGLVTPTGTDVAPVVSALTRELLQLKYRVATIRLSDQIAQLSGYNGDNKPEDERIGKLMDFGTKLRERSGRGDVVAILGIAAIMNERMHEFGGEYQRNAYILRSIKHPHEVQTLRNTYGKGFILISVYAPRDIRVNALTERISRSAQQATGARAKAEALIERDEIEEGTVLGQDVKDAFPLADLFVDGREASSLGKEIYRFLELLFGHPFHTPSRDEHGMYHAKSAALRSADINRQVGAAILTESGDLLSVGCNDVPKAGGDLYWAGDMSDARDFRKGYDATIEHREDMLAELLRRLQAIGVLNSSYTPSNLAELTHELTLGTKKSALKGARVMNLLEFGRSVHAEMAALMVAARRGISVRGATLYSTTFPCHMCARHIVAAGIKRVVYVEPYPKSRAKQLHADSISVDPTHKAGSNDLVRFEPFVGVAPRQYLDIFDATDRRKTEDGKPVEWRTMDKKPRFLRFLNTYSEIEKLLVGSILPALTGTPRQ